MATASAWRVTHQMVWSARGVLLSGCLFFTLFSLIVTVVPVGLVIEERHELRRMGERLHDSTPVLPEGLTVALVWAAVAALAHTEPETFDRIVSGRSAKGMVALAWRARLGPRLAYQLQLRVGGLSPRQALAPRNGEWPLTADEMVWHLEFFGIADAQLRPVSRAHDR